MLPIVTERPRFSSALPFPSTDHAALFPQLAGSVYADWSGAAVPPAPLIRQHTERLLAQHLGNPHSHHSSSTQAHERVGEARSAVLRYFHADPAEYDVVWTANATSAIQLLQHYLFEGGELLLSADNHNSMNGLREIARRHGATVRYSPLREDFTLDGDTLQQRLSRPRTQHHRLFGFPAKSNYSGVEHSLTWIEVAQAEGWDVLLDAAAYCANNRLDLSRHKPEFVPISFYKLFGYPTGVGCMLVKKAAYRRLHKRWFAGGTILLVSVMADFYASEPHGPARYEDGTVNFQMIPAITEGLGWLEHLGDRTTHAVTVATRLYDRLRSLEVRGNSIRIYSPRGADMVTFSVLRQGEVVDAWLVERAADAVGIQVRTGCFCNPGVNEKAMGYTVAEYERTYHAGVVAEDFTLEAIRRNSGGKPIGAVRASFGYANTLDHADRIADWVASYLENLPRSGPASITT
jgi:selenocysteine lyase/cysteine desulfurase